MQDWTLSKIVWVADRGFSSERNRRYLRQYYSRGFTLGYRQRPSVAALGRCAAT